MQIKKKGRPVVLTGLVCGCEKNFYRKVMSIGVSVSLAPETLNRTTTLSTFGTTPAFPGVLRAFAPPWSSHSRAATLDPGTASHSVAVDGSVSSKYSVHVSTRHRTVHPSTLAGRTVTGGLG